MQPLRDGSNFAKNAIMPEIGNFLRSGELESHILAGAALIVVEIVKGAIHRGC